MLITHRKFMKVLGKREGMKIYRRVSASHLKSKRIRQNEKENPGGFFHIKAWESEEIKELFPEYKEAIERIEND